MSCSYANSYYFNCFISYLLCYVCLINSLFFCYSSTFSSFNLEISKFNLSLTPYIFNNVFLKLSLSSSNILWITTSPLSLSLCSNSLRLSLNSSMRSFFYDNSSAKPWRLILFLPISFSWRRSLSCSSTSSLLIFCSKDWLTNVSWNILRERGRLPFLDLNYPYRKGPLYTPIEEYSPVSFDLNLLFYYYKSAFSTPLSPFIPLIPSIVLLLPAQAINACPC